MKPLYIFLLLHSCLLFPTLSIRIQDQFTFQMLQDAVTDPSPETSSTQSQTENHILTNTDICNNLVEYLLVFGEHSTSRFQTCPEKYSLLGNKNSLVQNDQPQCLLTLSKIFCTYEIVKDPVRPHPDDLRYFITQTMSRCIRVIFFPLEKNPHNISRAKYGSAVLAHIFVHLWILIQRLWEIRNNSVQILSKYINMTQKWRSHIRIVWIRFIKRINLSVKR